MAKSQMMFYGAAYFDGVLKDEQLRAQLRDFMQSSHPDIKDDEFEMVSEDALLKIRDTDRQIVRMSGKAHVDAFFKDGTIRLGTLAYYCSIIQQEIGDKSEGRYVLVASNSTNTFITELTGGFNYYVLCCTNGYPPLTLMDGFAHDDSFEIVSRKGFARAIGRKIAAISTVSSRCLYSNGKVLNGKLPEGYEFNGIGNDILDMYVVNKYFVKPFRFKHQNEFRFLWQVEEDVVDPIVIKCPEAIKYCRRK